MWPVLLHMTRDECRLKLRRLELEAYSNMVNVLRAQGTLGDNRKKLLEELRAVLHISQDRHSAEARRVSNDQILATIADQLSGPNTGIAWICEGRRRVPLLPRGIPQTMYTEIADKAAEAATAENKEILKRLAAEKLIASKINEEEMMDVEGYNQEALMADEIIDESLYAPIAMEDQTSKLWETELITRKRKPEGGGISDGAPSSMKNKRNIPANTNQKHLNLSQIYSKFSQQASKPAGQSKHSYNQVSKVSTSKSNKSKSNQPHAPRSTPHKPRAPKTPRLTKAQKKALAQAQEVHTSPGKYNATMPLEYAGPPNTFQASYAQAVLGGKTKPDFLDELKPKGGVTDSPAMQLLTQPTLPHELEVSRNTHPDDHPSLQAQSTPVKYPPTPSKPHVIIKNREIVDRKPARSDLKILQKPADIKLLSNRQMVIAPQKQMNTPTKLVTTKVIGSIPKHRGTNTPVLSEKMIVVSKPAEYKNPPARVIVTSSANTHTPRERTFSGNPAHRIPETLTPKGLPATDLKVSTKALVLNPKGQKMVVVPASKAHTKPDGQIPLIHFKGISTAMKLLPISSQPQAAQIAKSPAIQVLSKPPSQAKIIGMDNAIPIKTANLADIVPVKGMTPSTPKLTNPILRPSSTKGNVIVVQKGTPIGKALAFAKNGNDMSKIIMGKNVTQLLQASKTETDATKPAGNVIVLELNNEQSGRPTTMSEILDSRTSGARAPDNKPITPDTPVLFDSQITEETCNANSLDSTTESLGGIVDPSLMIKDESKSNYSKDSQKDSSSVTDWEMELDTVVERKDKDDDDDKLNSLHLDLGMSSDSDSEYMATGRKTKSKQSRQRATTSGESGEVYSAMSVATRTLLSQLQDEGSSSNDSSFALKARITRIADSRLDRAECDELTKAKEKLSEKVRDALSQRRRIDLYSTAIAPSDINLESFAYLDEGIMVGDEVFDDKRERRADADADADALDVQLSHILGVEANSNDSQPVSEHMPLSK